MQVVLGRWLILVVIFAVPLMLIRRQMRRPDRPVPATIRGLSWLARDYRQNTGVLRAGLVIFGLGAGMVVGYGSVRLPNAGDYAREISPPSIEPAPAGLLSVGLVITALSVALITLGAVRSPRVDPPARFGEGGGWMVLAVADAMFLVGLLTAVVVSTESARQVEPFAFWVVLHFGLLINRPWRS